MAVMRTVPFAGNPQQKGRPRKSLVRKGEWDTGSGYVDPSYPEDEGESGLHPDVEASLVGIGERHHPWQSYQELGQALGNHPVARILRSPQHLIRAYHDHLIGITPPQYRNHPTFKQEMNSAIVQKNGGAFIAPQVGRFVENMIRHGK